MKHLFIILIFSFPYAEELPFHVGEKFNYEFQFNILEAGQASLEVIGNDTINGHPCYNIQFIAGTSYWGDFLFTIRDTISIWIDQNTLSTRQIRKSIHEGNYHKNTDILVYEDEHYATSNGDTINIKAPVQDPYSLFYYLRTLPLTVGDIYSFTAIDGRELTDVKLKVDRQTRVQTPMQWWDCIKDRPYKDTGNLLKNEGEMTIWFSNDKNKYPVRIRIELKYGSLILELLNIS